MVLNNNLMLGGIFGGIITAFVAVIIGVNLLIPVADTVGVLTGTFSETNRTFTASNNTAVSFIGTDQNITNVPVFRDGATTLINNSNYTVDINSGLVTMTIAYADDNSVATQVWGVDYSYNRNSFINDAAARSVTNLIPLFFALAIMAAGFLAVRFDMFKFN